MRKLLGLVLAGLLSATGASAATIDFTSSNWNGANGQSSFSFGGVTISTPIPLVQSLNKDADGIGVRPGDEIGAGEWLRVVFAVPQTLQSITLSALFTNDYRDCFIVVCGPWQNEKGRYALNDDLANPVLFEANSSSGLLTLVFPNVPVTSISFLGTGDFRDDYELRSISVTAVPEPASMFLLGTGLVGLASRMRRRKQ